MRALRLLPGRTALVLAALVVIGCGDTGPKRYAVSGTVTLKGHPVEEGLINFEPLDDGPTMSGSGIKNGRYSIPRDKGLAAGRYRISIYAGDGTSSEGNAGFDVSVVPKPKPGFKGRGQERVPKEFNEKSKVVREVTPSGPNTFDFKIP